MADQESDSLAALCPICFEPPHNAVLLICSSHAHGCCALLCDTSTNLSNCLTQYLNSFPPPLRPSCPLCRGEISDRVEADAAARTRMDAKPRICPHKSCDFTGNYSELMEHASKEHPSVNPSEVDASERRNEWAWVLEDETYLDSLHILSPTEIPISVLTATFAVEQSMVFGRREFRRTQIQIEPFRFTDTFISQLIATETSLDWGQGMGTARVRCCEVAPNVYLVQAELWEAVPGGGSRRRRSTGGRDCDRHGWDELYHVRRLSVFLEC